MAPSDSVAVFVPILFLLVVELANITRSTLELSEIANKNSNPIVVRGKQTIFGYDILPNLGRFLFIHWGSMMLLSMTSFVGLTFTNGILLAGLVFATMILLYLYPVFEVSEYDGLLSTGDFPASYWNHLKYVSILLTLILVTPSILAMFEMLKVEWLGVIYLAIVFVGVPFLSARSFTAILANELEC